MNLSISNTLLPAGSQASSSAESKGMLVEQHVPPTLMPTPLTPPSSSKQSPGTALEDQITFRAV